jgi:5'-3' exonuclease
MGIKYFNRYLRDNCSRRAIRRMDFKQFRGKTIVIDTSIFLYRYKKKHALLENMYMLMSLLVYYGVKPIFIFDGHPPEAKRELLLQRIEKKRIAREEMWILKQQLQELTKDQVDVIEDSVEDQVEIDIDTMKEKIMQLEKDSMRITRKDMDDVKHLMTLYGIPYIEAPEEADQLCAYLVNSNMAWACMSDDMDMFTYNCKRVLREPNLLNQDVLMYSTDVILQELHIPEDVCILLLLLLGTDYTSSASHASSSSSSSVSEEPDTQATTETVKIHSFDIVLDWYRKYEKDPVAQSSHIWFYPWLVQQKCITREKETELWDLHRLFGTQYNVASEFMSTVSTYLDMLKPWKKPSGDAYAELQKMLIEKEGFIFIENTKKDDKKKRKV